MRTVTSERAGLGYASKCTNHAPDADSKSVLPICRRPGMHAHAFLVCGICKKHGPMRSSSLKRSSTRPSNTQEQACDTALPCNLSRDLQRSRLPPGWAKLKRTSSVLGACVSPDDGRREGGPQYGGACLLCSNGSAQQHAHQPSSQALRIHIHRSLGQLQKRRYVSRSDGAPGAVSTNECVDPFFRPAGAAGGVGTPAAGIRPNALSQSSHRSTASTPTSSPHDMAAARITASACMPVARPAVTQAPAHTAALVPGRGRDSGEVRLAQCIGFFAARFISRCTFGGPILLCAAKLCSTLGD